MNTLPQNEFQGRSQVDLIKSLVAKGCTDDELSLMLYTADKLKLDLLTQQIHAIKVYDPDKRGMVVKPYLGITAFRIIAQRTGEYEGQQGPFWYDGEKWCDYWVKDEAPKAAKVGVWRKGFKEICWGFARFQSYVQTHKNKNTGELVRTGFWQKGPESMIAKVAEAIALRKAFSNDLSGLYTFEEMSHKVGPNDAAISVKTETAKRLEGATYSEQKQQPEQDSKVTQPQLRRMFTLLENSTWSIESLRESLEERYGISSSRDLIPSQYQEVCEALEANQKISSTTENQGDQNVS